MPLAKPHRGESKQTFLSRCYGDANTRKEFDNDNNQIGGYCYTAWNEHKAKAAYVVQAGDDEYIVAKEPIDSDIEKRKKRAGDPPQDAYPNPEKGGPGSAPNPDNSTAPSKDNPDRGSDNADSMDDKSAKPKLDSMRWYMGSYTLALETDPNTGYAKWPLSFKRIEKDVKRPNKPKVAPDTPKNSKQEQPPTAA